MTLGELLVHKRTQEVMDRLAKGEPPNMVAAALAGDLVSTHIAKVLGVKEVPAPTTAGPAVQKKAVPKDDVIDAEFREIK